MEKVQETRKPYVAPKLTTHGEVKDLTQGPTNGPPGSGPILLPGTL